MTTSLAAQLASIAARSTTNPLDLKAQRVAHSQSLIFDPAIAANQDLDTLYTICTEGLHELCLIDKRFTKYQGKSIFSEQSKAEDRTQMTEAENIALDRVLEDFLALVGSRLLLKPAIKAVEWLIRRFRVHEQNTSAVLLTFLPYHTAPIFPVLLSILPANISPTFRFLGPYIRSRTNPPRDAVVYAATSSLSFNSALSDHVLSVAHSHQDHITLVSFWAGIMVEAVAGMLNQNRSGRSGVRVQKEEDVLLHVLPTLNQGLTMRNAPELRIGCYMVLSLLAVKIELTDEVLAAMMQAVVVGWTNDTIIPGMGCLAMLADARELVSLPAGVAGQVMRVEGLLDTITVVAKRRKADKLLLCIVSSYLKELDRFGSSKIDTVTADDACDFVRAALHTSILSPAESRSVIEAVLLIAQNVSLSNAPSMVEHPLRRLLVDITASVELQQNLQSVLLENRVDVDGLEAKFQTILRPFIQPTAETSEEDSLQVEVSPSIAAKISSFVEEMSSNTTEASSFLMPSQSAEFSNILQVLSLAASRPASVRDLLSIPLLRREAALQDPLFLSFLMRVWCGPNSTSVRVIALRSATEVLSIPADQSLDCQALLPYLVVVLSDPSRKVRKAAAETLRTLHDQYVRIANHAVKQSPPLGFDTLYGQTQADADTRWMTIEEAGATTDVLTSAIEECIVDYEHIGRLMEQMLNNQQVQKSSRSTGANKLRSTQRSAFYSMLSSHVRSSPLLLVKFRLLSLLNVVKKVNGTSRTRFLLPVLQDWVKLPSAKVEVQCRGEHISVADLGAQMANIISSDDEEGLKVLTNIILNEPVSDRSSLVDTMASRLSQIWQSLGENSQQSIALSLLDAFSIRPPKVRGHITHILRSISLSSVTMEAFLDKLHLRLLGSEHPQAGKRRKTSHDQKVQLFNENAKDMPTFLDELTLMLELIDGSKPEKHPELLGPLFQTLADIQHLRTTSGWELAYLQSIVLSSLVAIVNRFKGSSQKFNHTVIRADVLIDSFRSTTSPQAQNAALLLVSSLAVVAPEVILHSVMPVFTFMGATAFQQNDEYSMHVINKTIKDVIPPLIDSLRSQNRDPVVGSAELLLSFVAAYEHISPHRRLSFYNLLIQTLGEEEFLFALLAILTVKYTGSDTEKFAIDLASQYSAKTQLRTIMKLDHLVKDALKSERTYSVSLLTLADMESSEIASSILKLIELMTNLLSSGDLVIKVEHGLQGDVEEKGECDRLRETISSIFTGLSTMADIIKVEKESEQNGYDEYDAIHNACGAALVSWLNLLSTADFISAIAIMIDGNDENFHANILRALVVHLRKSTVLDSASQLAVLEILPRITAILQDSSDVTIKKRAIESLDIIMDKCGRKSPEAATVTADCVARTWESWRSSDHRMHSAKWGLDALSMLFFTTTIEVLGAGFLPIFPKIYPSVLSTLAEIKSNDLSFEETHRAACMLLDYLLRHVSWILSVQDLAHLISVLSDSPPSEPSSVTGLKHALLSLIPKQTEARVCLAAVEQSWRSGMPLRPSELEGLFKVISGCIDRHTKSTLIKNAPVLGEIFLMTLDLRRSVATGNTKLFEKKNIDLVEDAAHEILLTMIMKMNDTTFRPMFTRAFGSAVNWPRKIPGMRTLKLISFYRFLTRFFESLKSIVTGYSSYIIDSVVEVLETVISEDPASRDDPHLTSLWKIVLQTLRKSFEFDQDGFWQSPSHFKAAFGPLMKQIEQASRRPMEDDAIPAIAEFAGAIDSTDQHKELNMAILMFTRSPESAVRLTAVKCQKALVDRLGEEWLALLPEMLPFISELQEDDDELVERETNRWIVKIEDVLGESLDDMLQ